MDKFAEVVKQKVEQKRQQAPMQQAAPQAPMQQAAPQAPMQQKKEEKKPCDENAKMFSWCWLSQDAINVHLVVKRWVFALAILVIILFIANILQAALFENKSYDPYGMGIRHFVSRDDTGAVETSLEERQVGGQELKLEPMIEQLTSNPEPPNFSEYYNIEANIKDGSVMIDRENFENSELSLDKLVEANKGL
jgi:hypothetical protein